METDGRLCPPPPPPPPVRVVGKAFQKIPGPPPLVTEMIAEFFSPLQLCLLLSLSLSLVRIFMAGAFFRLASIQRKTKCEHRWLVRGPEKYMGGKTEMKGGRRGFKQKTAALPQFSRRGEWPLLNKMGAIPPLCPFSSRNSILLVFYCVRWRRKGKGGSRPYANIAPTLLMNEL